VIRKKRGRKEAGNTQRKDEDEGKGKVTDET